ncbi:MAG: metal ABC transporter permease [Halobacteriales archaeon]
MPRDRRNLAIRLGLVLVGVFVCVMAVFLIAHWLRPTGPGGAVYDGLLDVGRGVDALAGTNALRHPFVWHSLATGAFVGVVAPLVGTYLVHREMALIGETLAHTAFAGVAVGLLFAEATGWNVSLLISALVVAVLGAFGVEALARRTDAFGDVPIAIMLTGSFAVGTILIGFGDGLTAISVDSFLFGNIAFVTVDGARLMAVMTVAVVAVIAVAHRPLTFITFDQEAARVARLNVRWYNAVLIVATAVVVVGAMQILGIILVAAMLVVPVAAASQLARSFHESILLAILIGEVAVVLGFVLSLEWGVPAGGTIVVVAIGWYLLAVLLGRR